MKNHFSLLLPVIIPYNIFAQINSNNENNRTFKFTEDSTKINLLMNDSIYNFIKIGFKTGEVMYFDKMTFKESKYLIPKSEKFSDQKFSLIDLDDIYISKRSRLLEGAIVSTILGIILVNTFKTIYEEEERAAPDYTKGEM
jgi:hypothetical protein